MKDRIISAFTTGILLSLLVADPIRDLDYDPQLPINSNPTTPFPKIESKTILTWSEIDRPTSINIPKIGFTSDTIKFARIVTGIDGKTTYEAPIDELATPQNPIRNKPLIYGHSSWHNIRRDFANIEHLDSGDTIYVTNELGQIFQFKVNGFQLADREEGIPNIFNSPELTLILYTSAKTELGWILNPENVSKKVGQNRPPSLNSYLIFLITAEPVSNTKN